MPVHSGGLRSPHPSFPRPLPLWFLPEPDGEPLLTPSTLAPANPVAAAHLAMAAATQGAPSATLRSGVPLSPVAAMGPSTNSVVPVTCSTFGLAHGAVAARCDGMGDNDGWQWVSPEIRCSGGAAPVFASTVASHGCDLPSVAGMGASYSKTDGIGS